MASCFPLHLASSLLPFRFSSSYSMALATFIPGHPPYFKIQFHTQAIKYMVVWRTHFVLAHFLDSTVTSKWQREEEGGPFWTKKKVNNTANRDWKGAFRPWDDTYILHIDVWYIRVIQVSICVPLLLFCRPFRDMFYVLNFPFSFPLKFYPQSLLLLRSTCFHYKIVYQDFLHNFLIYRGPEPLFSLTKRFAKVFGITGLWEFPDLSENSIQSRPNPWKILVSAFLILEWKNFFYLLGLDQEASPMGNKKYRVTFKLTFQVK